VFWQKCLDAYWEATISRLLKMIRSLLQKSPIKETISYLTVSYSSSAKLISLTVDLLLVCCWYNTYCTCFQECMCVYERDLL